MTEKPVPSQDNSKTQEAILLLQGETDLYWKKLAEVPFLLRNILTLQGAGIKNLLIWTQSPVNDIDIHLQKLVQDPRIHLEVKWGCFAETPGSPALVLDGSTLLEKSNIVKAIASSIENKADTRGFIFFPKSLEQNAGLEEKELYKIIPPDESSRLTTREDFAKAETRLLKSVGLNNDSPMDRLVTRFISRHLTRLLIKTALTPNQVTFLSFLIGLGSAWFFYQGTYYSGITGSLLFLLSAWVDCTDGEIARLKFMETSWGARFDIFCDNIVHFFVFYSIGMGLFFMKGDPIYKLYGGLAVYGSLISFMIIGGIILKKKQRAGEGKTPEENLVDQLANRDFTYFLFVMACLGRLDIFIILTAAGANLFALYLMYRRSQHC